MHLLVKVREYGVSHFAWGGDFCLMFEEKGLVSIKCNWSSASPVQPYS